MYWFTPNLPEIASETSPDRVPANRSEFKNRVSHVNTDLSAWSVTSCHTCIWWGHITWTENWWCHTSLISSLAAKMQLAFPFWLTRQAAEVTPGPSHCLIVGWDSASIPHTANSADLNHASPLPSVTFKEKQKKMCQPEVLTPHWTADERINVKAGRESSDSIRKISASPAAARGKISMDQVNDAANKPSQFTFWSIKSIKAQRIIFIWNSKERLFYSVVSLMSFLPFSSFNCTHDGCKELLSNCNCRRKKKTISHLKRRIKTHKESSETQVSAADIIIGYLTVSDQDLIISEVILISLWLGQRSSSLLVKKKKEKRHPL